MSVILRSISLASIPLLGAFLIGCDSNRNRQSTTASDQSPVVSAQLEELSTDPSKQYEIGLRLLREGKVDEGVELIEKAALQGHNEAIFDLGRRFWEGDGVQRDYLRGEKWLKIASSDDDNPVAQMILAEAYYRGDEIPKNDEEAVRLLEKIVGAVPSFGTILGEYYATGTVVPLNYVTAFELYKSAAEYGDSGGQVALGYCYANGQGVPKSDSDAVVWFTKAAEQGSPQAQENLGIAYTAGIGVEIDFAEAAFWREKAADAGIVDCQLRLGGHYLTGKGVPMDSILAYKWFNIAAAAGNEKAEELRDSAASSMTPEQIAEAQELSRDWKPKRSGR